MPINIANCRANPTCVSLGNFNGGAFIPVIGPCGVHRIYTAANCRVNLNPTLNHGAGIEGVTSLDPQAAPAGDTYFLPFATNEISSLVLPAPGAAAALSFLTTNMSGCMFFVDRVVGVAGSFVVYHANNEANAPAGHLGGQQPALELPACTTRLNQLYNLARAELAAAPYNLNLMPVANVAKPAYNAGARDEVLRKTNQRRTNVEFTGGTMVFGAVVGGAWEIHWATYGSCEYDRPKSAPAGWFGNRHFNPTAAADPKYKMLGTGQLV